MRFSNIVLAYFIMGAVMWGGGVIQWENAGIGKFLVEDPGQSADINEETSDELSQISGPIQEAAGAFGGGGLIAVWNIVMKLIGSMFWPITTLDGLNAPIEVVVLLGGTPTMAFYGALIRMVRRSA